MWTASSDLRTNDFTRPAASMGHLQKRDRVEQGPSLHEPIRSGTAHRSAEIGPHKISCHRVAVAVPQPRTERIVLRFGHDQLQAPGDPTSGDEPAEP